MKRCTKCHQLKKDDEFYKDKRQISGLRPECKTCGYKQIRKQRGYKNYREQKKKEDWFVGGYMVAILNYAKKGEYKYTIKSTTGEIFKTNDKQEFFDKLKDCLIWWNVVQSVES